MRDDYVYAVLGFTARCELLDAIDAADQDPE